MKKIIIACFLLFTTCCSVLQPPPDLAWDHNADSLIISTAIGGGMQPEAAYRNEIPRGLVWGDGRVVWQTSNDERNRLVWQGQLDEEEMADLLQTFADKGFFRMDNHYSPKDEVFDSSSTSLNLNLLAEQKKVGEYHDGAPRKFHELVGLISSGAGAEGVPYVPERGYLTAVYLNSTADAIVPTWSTDSLELNLNDATGIWVDGDVLARAWEVVNLSYWSPRVSQDGDVYELYLELPELTGREP